MKKETPKQKYMRHYKRSKSGVLSNLYSRMKGATIRRNGVLGFTCKEFKEWCSGKPEFHLIYEEWAQGGYDTNFKPSIDRVNPLRGYTFDNMQITTWKFNRKKGDSEKELLCGKRIIQCDMMGNHIKNFPSIAAAVRELKLNQSLIVMCINGQRKSTGGFKFLSNSTKTGI